MPKAKTETAEVMVEADMGSLFRLRRMCRNGCLEVGILFPSLANALTDHHFWVLTNFWNDVKVETEIHVMIRKPHTDCFPTPATFTWQGAGVGTFM
jgi:hypothetical protein